MILGLRLELVTFYFVFSACAARGKFLLGFFSARSANKYNNPLSAQCARGQTKLFIACQRNENFGFALAAHNSNKILTLFFQHVLRTKFDFAFAPRSMISSQDKTKPSRAKPQTPQAKLRPPQTKPSQIKRHPLQTTQTKPRAFQAKLSQVTHPASQATGPSSKPSRAMVVERKPSQAKR